MGTLIPAGMTGSSPLARGTPSACLVSVIGRGLIPAHAGNTVELPGLGFPGWAHPRSRGEHSPAPDDELFEPGSSPLARGTRHGGRKLLDLAGLIPARAGNTDVLFRR